jgi:hypothetical protein
VADGARENFVVSHSAIWSFHAKGSCASDEGNHLRNDCCAFYSYSLSTKFTIPA